MASMTQRECGRIFMTGIRLSLSRSRTDSMHDESMNSRREILEEMEIKISGGPDGLGPYVGIAETEPPDRVALKHLNGYEHFERAGRDGEVPAYRWIYSTKIAE
ncbi:DUF5988 family protein [Streptomyces bacillaris]|uniref:DUF5988 family protein n=1 Tax=Streptomyces bacillaris TaxID=68179 RepID=UPI0034616A7F